MKFKKKIRRCMVSDFSIDREQLLCFGIVLYYFWQSLNLFIQKGLFGQKILLGINYVILIVAFFFIVLSSLKNRTVSFIFMELLAFAVFFISYVLGNADNKILIYNLIWSLGICIPLGMAFAGIDDKEKIYRYLYIISKHLIAIIALTYILEFKVWNVYLGEYDMVLSYTALLPCTILCNEVLEHIRIRDVVWLVIGLGMNFLYGCRGANVCFLLFFVLKVVLDIESGKKKYGIILCGLIISIIGISVLIILINSGVNTRTTVSYRVIEKLLNGEFFKSQGRRDLYDYYFNIFMQNPYLGWGVCGKWLDSGNYPHNFFVEVVLSFGIIGGLGIVLVLIIGVVVMFKESAKAERMLMCIYLSNAASLLLSGTFLQNTAFYITVALIIGRLRKREAYF